MIGMIPASLFILVLSSALSVIGSSSTLHPSLERRLLRISEEKGEMRQVNIIVQMKGGVTPAIEALASHEQARVKVPRGERIAFFAEALESQATSSQASVLELLDAQPESAHAEAQSFWVSNSVYIRGASPELIQALSGLDQVLEIHEENIIVLDDIIDEDQGDFHNITSARPQWGIMKIGAHAVWRSGNRGQGIRVANIDTGVLVTHEALAGNYVRQNGWFDPYDKSTIPNDANGHGTHTMGTMVGAKGVGVAPEAKWMACKGCTNSGCTEAALLACGQYILCPTDAEGKNKNCALAPHVSSNSWGGGQGRTWYGETIRAWRAAGIIPVFANGNSGPKCGSANSPGDQDSVIAVGASTATDSLASFSSVGPAKNGLMKPDVSAPGHKVRSAWFDSKSAYKSISGTSMACPHTAGAIALMLAESPKLTYDEIKSALQSTCNTQSLNPTKKNCGGVNDGSVFPNHAFGHGVIDIRQAVQLARKSNGME